ncbi:hypothetical protein ACHAQA_002703 [Verticillium albo-atrum]
MDSKDFLRTTTDGQLKLDEEVIKCKRRYLTHYLAEPTLTDHTDLPREAVLVEARTWGSSAWTKTARITVKLTDGSLKSYFLKCATYPGPAMMEGEFNSIDTIHKLMPAFAPKPHGWGQFSSASNVSFLVMDFLDMEPVIPAPDIFCALMADMHGSSVSPTGMFGFQVPTCHGKNLHRNRWTTSWKDCYAALLDETYDMDMKANESWPLLEVAFAELKRTVLPALLDPLQANGRNIKPCLVHGDLWEENTGTKVQSGQPVIFDASCMYAHNEFDLGIWRRDAVHFKQPYFEEYLARMPPSEPASQWDDRNRLYSLKFNLTHSSHYPGSSARIM